MRTTAGYLIITAIAWALWLWPTPNTPTGQSMWSAQALPVRVEIVSQGQHMHLRAGKQNHWLEVQSSKKPTTYPTDPQRTKTLLSWLKQPSAQRIEAPAPLETYGLSKQVTTVRIQFASAQTQTLHIGKPTFGQRGFYIQRADRPDIVYVNDSPSVRWLKFARGYLPDNHLHPLKYQTTQRIKVTHEDQGQLKMVQKQIDRADFAYWSWSTREGASRMARRYAKTLLRVRFSGGVVSKAPLTPQMTWTLTGTDQQAYTIRMAKQGSRWLISSSWLENQWFALSAKTAARLQQVWAEMKQAEPTEQLYPPPNPDEPAHHEH